MNFHLDQMRPARRYFRTIKTWMCECGMVNCAGDKECLICQEPKPLGSNIESHYEFNFEPTLTHHDSKPYVAVHSEATRPDVVEEALFEKDFRHPTPPTHRAKKQSVPEFGLLAVQGSMAKQKRFIKDYDLAQNVILKRIKGSRVKVEIQTKAGWKDYIAIETKQ